MKAQRPLPPRVREEPPQARQRRAEVGLPDRVFVKIASETKPTYADLTSPLFVSSLATMLRSAHQTGGPNVPLTISETLPDTDGCWVPDATGRRYVSELRLHLVDPMVAPGGKEVDR